MSQLFSLDGKTAVITGASGAIGGAISEAYARAGADIALIYNNNSVSADKIVQTAVSLGRKARSDQVNILETHSLTDHASLVASEFGRIDILVNCAGGNTKAAITDEERRIFDLRVSDLADTINLNLVSGIVAPCLVYGPHITKNGAGGSIINISSMNAYRPLEGRPAYAAAKAAANNFTQWLACHLAKEYKPSLRVNAIAPGFFPNERMRDALFDENGAVNERGQKVIAHTPMGRLGDVEDLVGTAIWYASDASKFVTGTITPVDGGFNAYAGL